MSQITQRLEQFTFRSAQLLRSLVKRQPVSYTNEFNITDLRAARLTVLRERKEIPETLPENTGAEGDA